MMFNDDFDEFRARSYSGGFLSFAVDGKRSTSDPTTCSEPTATECDVTGSDVRVFETDVPPGRVYERRHSDEMRREQLKVEVMRPRVLSDPVSRPSADRSLRPPLRSFHISRRGKLLCHDSGGGFTMRAVVDRSQPRRRTASASSCEFGERRARRRASLARLSERYRVPTPSSQHPVHVQHPAPSSLTSTTFYRVVVVGSSGVGKSTMLTQFIHAAYAEEVVDSPQGSN